jgi:hypothetical protein
LEIKVNEGASPTKSALAYFDLNDNVHTKITFYCRVRNNGKTDTIAPSFIHSLDAQANLIRRTPANNYLTYLNNGTINNDDKLFIQSSPGSYATIKIPGIDTLNNRVINRAELIVETIPSLDDNVYAAPAVLFLDAVNATGDSAFTIRHVFVPSNSYPGYDITLLGGILKNKKYIFNISRYLQGIVTKKEKNFQLRLYAPFTTRPYFLPPDNSTTTKINLLISTPIAYGRVVLGGGSHPTNRMKLRIIYSKI